MTEFIVEGEPTSLEFKPEDWKFEIVINGVRWRLTEVEWGALIVNMSTLHQEYLEQHRKRREGKDIEDDQNQVIDLFGELRSRIDDLETERLKRLQGPR